MWLEELQRQIRWLEDGQSQTVKQSNNMQNKRTEMRIQEEENNNTERIEIKKEWTATKTPLAMEQMKKDRTGTSKKKGDRLEGISGGGGTCQSS